MQDFDDMEDFGESFSEDEGQVRNNNRSPATLAVSHTLSFSHRRMTTATMVTARRIQIAKVSRGLRSQRRRRNLLRRRRNPQRSEGQLRYAHHYSDQSYPHQWPCLYGYL